MKRPILLVEDDPNDALFVEMALDKAGLDTPLRVASDGQQALDYLRQAMQSGNAKTHLLPQLILLDLKLPNLNGHEVLAWIRQQPKGAKLPVIILTSSNHEADIEKACQLKADSYIVKPANPSELTEIARQIRDYWLQGKRLPAKVDHFNRLLNRHDSLIGDY